MARTKMSVLRKRTSPPPWPSEQQIRLFSTLPQEIVRRIFEIASEAWEDIDVNLALVSRSLRKVVESRLYRHLYFRAADPESFQLFYRTFCERDNTTRDFTYFRDTVRTFEVQGSPCVVTVGGERSHIHNIAKELVGLESLIVTGDVQILHQVLMQCSNALAKPAESTEIDLFPYKSLRKLGCSSYSLFTDDGDFLSHRAFRDITHLALSVFFTAFSWDSLGQLSALTHLSFDEVGDGIQWHGLQHYITALLPSCHQHLRVLIFPCIHDKYLDGGHIDHDNWDYKRDNKSGWGGMKSHYVLRVFPELPVEDWGQYCNDLPEGSHVNSSELQLMWRLALGLYDPRVVVSTRVFLPADLIFRDDIIDQFEDYYHSGSVVKEDRWRVAERVIERRVSRLQTAAASK